jgi:hypothetical protein
MNHTPDSLPDGDGHIRWDPSTRQWRPVPPCLEIEEWECDACQVWNRWAATECAVCGTHLAGSIVEVRRLDLRPN